MFKWLKRKRKKTKMEVEAIENRLANFKSFQWVKSENAGNVCRFAGVEEDDGAQYVRFDDGSRVNYELLDEYVKCLDIEIEEIRADPTNGYRAQVGTAKLGPVAVVQQSPVRALLDKQKANPTEVQISLSLNIPTAQLYGVIRESFDGAEEDIINYIVESIDINLVREAVKKTLTEHYGQQPPGTGAK